jgi:hypothetical protein
MIALPRAMLAMASLLGNTSIPSWLSNWIGSPSPEVSVEHAWSLPAWVTLLLILGLILTVVALYWPQKRILTANPATKRWANLIVIVLGTLRAVALVLVLWMLAQWFLQPFETDRPMLAVLFDRSASMGVEEKQTKTDSTNSAPVTRFQKLTSAWDRIPARVRQQLETKYRLRGYSIGDNLTELESSTPGDLSKTLEAISPTAPVSRLGDCLRDLLAATRGQSLAGVVIFTDGVSTQGLGLPDAANLARRQLVPMYFVGVGQPRKNPDLWIADLVAPQMAFQGDTINFQAMLHRSDVAQLEHRVRLVDVDSGATLDETLVKFSGDKRDAAIQLKLATPEIGTRAVRLQVDSLEGEADVANNQLTHVVEVRDTAISVLLVQRFPSFEFRFLKHLLERTRQTANSDRPAFKLTSILEEGDPQYVAQDSSAELTMPVTTADFAKFDAVILGDASPSILTLKSQESLKQFVSEQGGGLMVFAGPNHMPFDFAEGPLSSLLPIEPLNRASTLSNDTFGWRLTDIGQASLPLQLEATATMNLERWNALPKQTWRAKGLRAKPVAQVLAVCDDSTQEPLLLSQFAGAGRVVFQATDESYQWQSYLGDDLYYQRYWIQMIRWLAGTKSSPTQTALQLTSDKSRYESGEVVRIDARVGNQILSRLSDQGVNVDLLRDGQSIQTIRLAQSSSDPSGFTNRIDQLAPGKYRAEVHLNVEHPPTFVDFSIMEKPGELSQLGPATEEMIKAAEISLGQYVPLDELDKLWSSLPNTKPIRLQPLNPIPIWNHWLVVSLLLVLLTTEWVIRRAWGLS